MQFNVVTGPSRAVIPYQQVLDTRSPIVRSLRAEDLLVVEVDRLLADVRAAVNYDLDVATEAAGRLTATPLPEEGQLLAGRSLGLRCIALSLGHFEEALALAGVLAFAGVVGRLAS